MSTMILLYQIGRHCPFPDETRAPRQAENRQLDEGEPKVHQNDVRELGRPFGMRYSLLQSNPKERIGVSNSKVLPRDQHLSRTGRRYCMPEKQRSIGRSSRLSRQGNFGLPLLPSVCVFRSDIVSSQVSLRQFCA